MISEINRFFKNLLVSFMYGIKNTEDDILKQKTTLSESNTIEQKMQMNDLGDALLKGEVTEEVEMLRDRTYFVADESKKFKVIVDTVGTTKSVKNITKPNIPTVFSEEGFDIVLVTDNIEVATGVVESLKHVGKYGIPNTYPLTFEYEYSPKFKLKDYVKKLVLRKNESGEFRVDLYVPKYSGSFERLEKIFDTEINKSKEGKIKPINLEFKTVEFISNKTYGVDDLCEFKFKMIKLISINEFDGKHILTYEVEVLEFGSKITDKYKNKKLRQGYEDKTKKNLTLNFNDDVDNKHTCDRCGAPIKSNHDYRISKQTIGQGVCMDCLQTLLNKTNV